MKEEREASKPTREVDVLGRNLKFSVVLMQVIVVVVVLQ